MKYKNIICGLLLVTTIISGTGIGTESICAAELNNEDINTSEEDRNYELVIEKSDLTDADKDWLINNEAYKEKYTEYISQGWELNSVEIEEVNQKAGDTKSRSTTVNTSQGKVILSDFIQPTKTQKHYNNKIYSNVQDIKKYASFSSNFLPTKVAWIASALFSIDTSQYAVFFNNGYQTLEENATLRLKGAYYKDGKSYMMGYTVSKIDVAGVVSCFYRDTNKTPHAKTHAYSASYHSLNYSSSTDELIALAKKHYKTGEVDEDIMYGTSTIRLN